MRGWKSVFFDKLISLFAMQMKSNINVLFSCFVLEMEYHLDFKLNKEYTSDKSFKRMYDLLFFKKMSQGEIKKNIFNFSMH